MAQEHQSSYADVPPVIDGVLDDQIWQEVEVISNFKTFRPDYGMDMENKTLVYVSHDDENLYFAFKCFDDPALIKTSISARDKIRDDDWVCINLDSFSDQQSLYGLYINPNGIQMDTRFAAGREDVGVDVVWYSKGVINEDGYTVEAKIPFKSIRYAVKDGNVKMGVTFERKITRLSTQGTFPEIYPGQSLLANMLTLAYHRVKKTTLLELLPAVTYSRSGQQMDGQMDVENKADISLTAKYGITSELVLDATINPDFSQVESDIQQIEVNQRFPVNYPERRPFFLEGNEHFNFAAGSSSIRNIVNTRSIVDPAGAAKLTGKIGKRNTISSFFAVDHVNTLDDEFYGEETANVGVFRYKRSISNDDSYIGFIGTGRERNDAFNVVYGGDGQLRIKKANVISAHYLRSETVDSVSLPTASRDAFKVDFERDTRKLRLGINFSNVDDGFRSDVGYIRRTGVSAFSANFSPRFYPQESIIQRIDWSNYYSLTHDKPSSLYEYSVYTSVRAQLPRNTRLSVEGNWATEVYEAEIFDRSKVEASVNSQITKRIYFRMGYELSNGVYYDNATQGFGNSISGNLNLQFSDNLNAEFNYNYSDLYDKASKIKYYAINIVRGKFTYQMNKYIFFRAIAQYNSYTKVLSPNLLASFTYIPGTVVHIGFGSVYEQIEWNGSEYDKANKYLQTNNGLFFKASYLWRL